MLDKRFVLTEDMDSLNIFFEANDLEVSDAEPVETNVIKAWKMEGEKGEIIAGICLAYREGEYIIDGIAVDQKLRGQRIGESLLKLAIEEVKARNGKRIFLVARAPEFFKTQGFRIVSHEDAPLFYECAGCPQFKVECFPEVMVLEV